MHVATAGLCLSNDLGWHALSGPILALAAKMGCYFHLVGASFLARKVVWALNDSLLAENADYCKFDNDWAWLGS